MKEKWPYFIANQPQAPNADLEVTDTSDNMPHGGVKDSGLGREGVRFAMEDMTEIQNLVIRTKPE